jgi:TRAP-type C4-dicarboxylate transport system substrate-binding protein
MAALTMTGGADNDLFARNFLFARVLFEETGGLIKVDIKPGLFPQKEVLYAVADGRTEIGWFTHNDHIGDQPLWGLPLLPFLFKDGTQMNYAWLYDSKIQELYQNSHNKIGVQQIALFSGPYQAVWLKKGVLATVDDFAGKKIRTSSLAQAWALKPLRAVNVTIPFAELFTSMERGIIDCAITGIGGGTTIGLSDICESVAKWPITPTQPYALVVNKKVFDSLPKELQDALMRAGAHAIYMVSNSTNTELQRTTQIAELGGVKVINPTPSELKKAADLMGETYDSWLQLTGAEGKVWLDAAKAFIAKEEAAGWVTSSFE